MKLKKHLTRLLALAIALLSLCAMSVGAFAATVSDATIDFTQTGSMDIYKYDVTNAEKDGVWDSSYVSTGVRDQAGVESVLGSSSRKSDLGNGEVAYGYAIKDVEFSYLRVADIRTYTKTEGGMNHVEVLYGIPANATTDKLLTAIGLTHANRCAPADQTVDGVLIYYYQSDTLVNALSTALAANSTTVKNSLENYVTANGGAAMPYTDSYGHTAASGLPLGLYLVVETSVPEMVTSTTNPFLVSLPMTSVNGSNASDGGDRWVYNVVMYPKNCTGIPTLEKTLREAKADTGKNNGTLNEISDGYAHTATGSAGDVVEYQIHTTLPSLTSEASYLTDYTFADELSKGITYQRDDVVLEFFTDKDCKHPIATWTQTDSVKKFSVAYGTGSNGASTMTISMTAEGLREINTNSLVYTGASMVNSGYSDCTLRITYKAKVNSDASLVCGDKGNPNSVVLTWKRTSSEDYDALYDDCHFHSYALDLIKQFSDNAGNFKNVEMLMYNKTDGYYVQASLHDDGFYYVTGHDPAEANATHFIPTDSGNIFVHGLEDDIYVITETKTDNGYTLLRDSITVEIVSEESDTLCDFYDSDALGVIQNDPRYTHIQKHLEHKLLTAHAKVDGNAVDMKEDDGSVNAIVPLTVVNTKGFDLPRTGSRGTWIYPVVGVCVARLAAGAVFFLKKKRDTK